MAAVTYYMQCRDSDSLILQVSQTDLDNVFLPPGQTVRSASFSANAGDSPDVVTPAGQPTVGGTYPESGPYTPPVQAYLKLEWSGDGTLNGMRYEMTPDGIRDATLTVKKWDALTDAAIASGGEVYWICPLGAEAKPNVGKITLDGNGEAQIVFSNVPADILGVVDIILSPEASGSPIVRNDQPMRLALS